MGEVILEALKGQQKLRKMRKSTLLIILFGVFLCTLQRAQAQIDFEHFDVSYSDDVFGNAADFRGFGIQHNDYNTTLQYTLSGNFTIEFWIKVSPVFENEGTSTSIISQQDGAINVYVGKGCNDIFVGGVCDTPKPVIGFQMISTEQGIGYGREAEIPGYNEWFHVALVSNQSVPVEIPDDFYNHNWDNYPGGAEKAAEDYRHNQTIDGEMSIYINGVKQKMIDDEGLVYFMRTPASELIRKSTNPLIIGSDLIWLDDFRIWELPKMFEGIRAGINREEASDGSAYATSNGLYAYFNYNAPMTQPGSGSGRVVPNMSRGAESPTNGTNGALAGEMIVNPYGGYPVFRSGHIYELIGSGSWGTPYVWKDFNETFPGSEDDITVNIQGSSSEDIVRLSGFGSAHSLLFKKGKIATNGGEFWCMRSTLGASADSYVITDKGEHEQVGAFVQSFWVQKDKFVNLPIGNQTDYLPVGITGKTWDGFRTWACVKEAIPSGLGNSNKSLNVPWDIKAESQSSLPKPGFRLKFQWNLHNEGSEFDREHVYIANYHNGQWRQLGYGMPAEVISEGVFAAVTDVDEFSEFTALGTEVALPVRLIDFKVKQESSVTNLNWITDMEENSSHFEVQRSWDAKSWEAVGTVQAKGSGPGIRNYTFTDVISAGFPKATAYYRLKMVDQDQTFAYSIIRSVRVDGFVSKVSIYPNPVSDQMITISNINPENISAVQVISLDGKKMADLKLQTNGRFHIPSSLASGTYILDILATDGSRSSEKVVIRH